MLNSSLPLYVRFGFGGAIMHGHGRGFQRGDGIGVFAVWRRGSMHLRSGRYRAPLSVSPCGRATFSREGRRADRGLAALSPLFPREEVPCRQFCACGGRRAPLIRLGPSGRSTFSLKGRRGVRGLSALSPASPPEGEGPGVRGTLSAFTVHGGDHGGGAVLRDSRAGAPSSVSPFGRSTFSHEGRRGHRGLAALSPLSP